MRVQLIVSGHIHGGCFYEKGAVIEVDPSTAKWLVDQKVGVIVPEVKQPLVKSKFASLGE